MNLTQYVGIPYVDGGNSLTGCDCWGLIRIIYEGLLDIYLGDVRGQVLGIRSGQWYTVNAFHVKQLDVLVFKNDRLKPHVGMAIDRSRMIHSVQSIGSSCIQRFDGIEWKNRLKTVYRRRS